MNRRTSLITAIAVGGALLAGTGAVAANIGVLTSADDDSIGNLSADTTVVTPSTVEAQVVDIYIEDPVTPSSPAPSTGVVGAAGASVQQFAVEGAGTVTVTNSSTDLFASDVQANEGWDWSTEQSSSGELTVTFVSGTTTYEFHAAVGADGQIEARVDQPIVNVVHASTPVAAQSVGSDDDHDDGEYENENEDEVEDEDEDEYDDDEYDDDEHDDEEDEDDEHEGGDDDD